MEPKKPGRPKKLNPEALQRIREVIADRMEQRRRRSKALAADVPLVLAEFARLPTNVELAAELNMSLSTLRTGIDEVLS
jgi:DNA-binding FadR family transcriptional regulator